ncbi:MAG: coenzyme F420-0:L-glutamate ligase [Gammaproteobacteria bacterium]|nr:coenzyme F420-0:L-glutamate ligase [Gammaproteobacteria bacterium]
MTRTIAFTALGGFPEIVAGTDLGALIRQSLHAAALEAQAGDALIVAQKIVSKAEGRDVDLATVTPTPEALELATRVRKDPRFVQLVLDESTQVLRAVPNILITRHRAGYVMANAGIDRSNVPGAAEQGGRVLLLPQDCDASARRLSQALGGLPVVISDSFGRPWRQGVVNVALGVAGLPAIVDFRGTADREGRIMQTSQLALADAVAAGAGLVMGEGREGTPVVHLRGLDISAPLTDGRVLLRPLEEDLFS